MTEASTHTCQYCEKTLTGRSDKRFCDTYCRNSYNNEKYRIEFAYENEVNATLRKNKRIISDFGADGKTRVPGDELRRLGFNFKYFTHIYESHAGTRYLFCYDYGYVKVKDEDAYVFIKWQDYMD